MKNAYIWLMNYDNGRITKVDLRKIVSVDTGTEIVDGKTYDYTVLKLEDDKKDELKVVDSPREIGKLMVEALMGKKGAKK